MAVMDERAAAVAQAVERVRGIVAERGAGRAGLEAVGAALVDQLEREDYLRFAGAA